MAAVAAFGLSLSLAFVCAPYPVEWAEGRVFETARLMLAGSPLYCDIHVLPCADLTYPPAYSAVIAALGKIFGLAFTAGRAVSFAALLWVLLGLYRIARAQCDRWTALAAPTVFLFFIEISFYAGSMRPDLLSLALVVSALATLIRWPTIRGTVSSALLLLAGLSSSSPRRSPRSPPCASTSRWWTGNGSPPSSRSGRWAGRSSSPWASS